MISFPTAISLASCEEVDHGNKRLEKAADVSPLTVISLWKENKATLDWVRLRHCWGPLHAVLLTEGFHSWSENYVEFRQLHSFAIIELAVLLHITTYFP